MNPTDDDFASMLAEFEGTAKKDKKIRVGDSVTGTVISVGKEHVFVDLGGKAEGILASAELLNADGKLDVKPGDQIEARVVDTDAEAGGIVLRRTVRRGPQAREELAQAFEHQIPVEGKVTGAVKGGLEVDIAGERAFCPASQIDNRFVEDLAGYVGQKYSFRITKYDVSGRKVNLVVSRRQVLEAEGRVAAVKTRELLAEGAILDGVVTGIKPFGAFVDLGGIEGMIHVSELGFERIEDPGQVLQVGQKVRVQVTKIEQGTAKPGRGGGEPKSSERIGLSLKALERDPWLDQSAQFRPGSRHKGKITRLQPYGAFCELAPGVEGLIHVSELADRRINHPKEVVSVGQEVTVQVLDLDPSARRISLSIAAVAKAQEADELAEAQTHVPRAPASLGTLAEKMAQMLEAGAKKQKKR